MKVMYNTLKDQALFKYLCIIYLGSHEGLVLKCSYLRNDISLKGQRSVSNDGSYLVHTYCEEIFMEFKSRHDKLGLLKSTSTTVQIDL